MEVLCSLESGESLEAGLADPWAAEGQAFENEQRISSFRPVSLECAPALYETMFEISITRVPPNIEAARVQNEEVVSPAALDQPKAIDIEKRWLPIGTGHEAKACVGHGSAGQFQLECLKIAVEFVACAAVRLSDFNSSPGLGVADWPARWQLIFGWWSVGGDD